MKPQTGVGSVMVTVATQVACWPSSCVTRSVITRVPRSRQVKVSEGKNALPSREISNVVTDSVFFVLDNVFVRLAT